MEMAFNMFFNTHTIFVIIDERIYKLNKNDLSREEVAEIPVPSKDNPIMVLHKTQFDLAKNYLMDVKNPFRINYDTAKLYNTIGFITDDELLNYKN